MHDDRHHPYPQPPHAPHYVVAAPMARPVGPDGGGVMYVNGVPQPLSRRSSRVVIAAIVFATCVVPLIIIAAVMVMMPDVDGMVDDATRSVPSLTVPAR
ncbi:hypothetical protein [Actinomycetospora soli]|uniref:hypothetical protein n=1 Tax=Actinomycetospora soli TaxID=2893887 RepID=UPI001E35540B|nr:hypothetical protein [Actinomycetospora soli]MCD2190192.1 hypothetical protein [Actinomycetospora soli]